MQNTDLSLITGLGGFALFIYGMLLLSDGLKQASGPWFRRVMTTLSARRLRSYALGLGMGAAMHSTATTVTAVGFINAGLLTLAGAIPLVAGANLGTTFAMQFVAFDKAWIWAAIAVAGLPMRVLPGNERRQRTGQAFMALALLFLGLQLMNQSLVSFREPLSHILTVHRGGAWSAMLAALAASMLFTVIIQSSGATIGILFSLANAGIFTDFSQIVPLVVGAHIGTCNTALISSIGTSPDARRGAFAHLYFNIIAGALTFALMPWVIECIHMLGGTPARQIANLHTLIMLLGGVVVVPASGAFLWLLNATLRFRNGPQEQSFLLDSLIENPRAALDAGDKELARITRIVRRGFAYNHRLINQPGRHYYNLVRQTEESVDLIRNAMRAYLMRVARFATNTGDIKRLQWMNLFLIYLERISDHNENLADLSRDLNQHLSRDELAYARTTCDQLYASVEPLLKTVEEIWNTDPENRIDHARQIREHRGNYLPTSENFQSEIVIRIASGKTQAITGFFLTEYLSEMDRIVRHTKKIAGLLEKSAGENFLTRIGQLNLPMD